MAVTSATPSITFTANGSTTDFAFNFVVPATDTTGTITDATADMSLSSAVLTVDTAGLFYTSDLQGKAITVTGAGVSSADLTTTILSVDSATQLTLNASASTAVTDTTISITTGTFNTTLKNNSDLLVFVDGTPKTITTDYTVRLNLGDDANKAGTVIFNSAPADGAKVVIIRDVTLQRTTDFQTGGALTAKSLNAQFDNVIMAVQDTQFDTAASAIKFPSDETLSTTTLPASSSRSNKILGFNSSGEISMRDDVTTGNFSITGTTITATTGFVGDVTGDITGDITGNITGSVTGDITSTGTSTFATVDINGGAIDGTTIGATTPAAVTTTSLTATTADINGGTIDGVTIGGATAGAATFTNLTASGTITLNGLTYPTSDGTLNQVLSTDGNGVVAFRSIEGLELFTALTDTPNTYTGHDGKYLKVDTANAEIVFDTLTSDDATQGSNNIYFSTSGATVNTTNLPEGTNLYYTDARADARVNNAIIDEDDFASDSATKVPTQQSTKAYIQSQIETKDNTDEITEGSTNLYYTDARARASVSVQDNGGDGSLGYNSTTGVITYTGPSASEVRAHISVTDAGGDGSLAYNNTTGVITYTGPSASEVRAHFTGGTGISITNGDVALDFSEFSTTNVVEGTNLYYTTARANSDFDTRLATKTTDNLTEGSNLYYTDARAQAVSINNVVEDTTPQLGGDLDVNGNKIITTSDADMVIKPDQTSATGNNGPQGEWGWSGGVAHFNTAISVKQGTDTADHSLLYNAGIQVTATHDSFPALVLKSQSDSGKFGNLWFARSGADASDAYCVQDDIVGGFYFSPYDEQAGNYFKTPGKFLAKATQNHANGALGTKLEWYATPDNSTSEIKVLEMQGEQIIVNPDNADVDFVVNGDTNSDVLKVDAGDETVSIGGSGKIITQSNGNLTLEPNGTGKVLINKTTQLTGGQTDGNYLSIDNFNGSTPITLGYPSPVLTIASEGTGSFEDYSGLLLHTSSTNGNGYSNIWIQRNKSNDTGTTGDLDDGDRMFGFYASASRNDGYYSNSAGVFFEASEDHTAGSAHGGKILLKTMDNGTTGYGNETTKLLLDDDVHVNPDNADVDFRVDGDVNDNILFVNAGTERVGVKTNAPTRDLQVNGTFEATTLYGDGSNLDIAIGDLSNVDLSGTLTVGHFLKWDGTNFVLGENPLATMGADLNTGGYIIKADGAYGVGVSTANEGDHNLKLHAGYLDAGAGQDKPGDVEIKHARSIRIELEHIDSDGSNTTWGRDKPAEIVFGRTHQDGYFDPTKNTTPVNDLDYADGRARISLRSSAEDQDISTIYGGLLTTEFFKGSHDDDTTFGNDTSLNSGLGGERASLQNPYANDMVLSAFPLGSNYYNYDGVAFGGGVTEDVWHRQADDGLPFAGNETRSSVYAYTPEGRVVVRTARRTGEEWDDGTNTRYQVRNEDVVSFGVPESLATAGNNYWDVSDSTNQAANGGLTNLKNRTPVAEFHYPIVLEKLGDFAITAATKAAIIDGTEADGSPHQDIVLTVPGHNFKEGEIVEINDVGGMTQLNGNQYIIADEGYDGTDKFRLRQYPTNVKLMVNGNGFSTYTSGGTIRKVRGNLTEGSLAYDTVKDNFIIHNGTAWGDVHTSLKPSVLANLTTTERNALTGVAGMTIFNTTESRIEYYDGSGWKYISGTAV